ncbi:hypothetical protein EDD36DRAFT_482666 [Exophiala viscosa]|uniref:Uncharacterized protein n=1 Tax=Exophiala viscosa TaxID=2486360 RepID=A0AAN6IAN4_9EURO|nr:hypothetical protein EDD36DRAFT_482666 [Exophiala viscosa]
MNRWKTQRDKRLGIIEKLLAELPQDPCLVNKEQTTLGRTSDQATKVVALVRRVRPLIGGRLRDVKTAIRKDPRGEFVEPIKEAAVVNAVDFALRLWLFVPLVLDVEDATFAGLMRSALPAQIGVQGKALSFGVNAKNLIRRGGFSVRTTSDLSKHLDMDDLTIWIFSHAAVLKEYQGSGFSHVFPDEFLQEVERTMQLLFPNKGYKSSRRTRKYVRKLKADLETGFELELKRLDLLSLDRYPYFGQRLADIQNRYDYSKPRNLRQWWFDRRNRIEWATLVIAVIVFVLTVVFGVIAVVTGVLQVHYSALSAHS